MFEFVWDFVSKYFLTEGYNIVNTVTYGLVLGFIVFKFLIPWLKGLLGGVDSKLVLMLLPFIFYGATLRELVDQGVGLYAGHTQYPGNYMLVSPGIYFTMFFVTLFCILAGKVVERIRKVDYRVVASGFGIVLSAYNLILILQNMKYPWNLVNVGVFFAISAVLLYALKSLFRLEYLDFESNGIIVLAHLFDASTTFVGVDLLGHIEKHVVPTFFINVFNTAAVMYPLKLLVLLPALHIIDKDLKDDEFSRRFIKFVIVVLGAGPAIRNMTLLLMG
ncbi:MAG: DUF63 family protein [Candidatus Altiarchaeota archaeon]